MASTDTNVGSFVINEMTEEQLKQIEEAGSVPANEVFFTEEDGLTSPLPLGIILHSSIVLNDAGLHLLDGSTLAMDGIYAQFCSWLVETYNADNSSVPVCTEEQYSQDIKNYGQCGRYVIGTDYIKLPKITKYVEGLSTLSQIGTSLAAGLPNITGSQRLGWSDASGGGTLLATAGTGAFYKTNTGTAYYSSAAASGSQDNTLNIDASRSNKIYGNSDTVQPQATKYPYYVVVATVKKTQIAVDIDNVVSELNRKADSTLSNVSYPAITKGSTTTGAGDRVIETYISSDGLTWYRKWASGWKECGGVYDVGSNQSSYSKELHMPLSFSNSNYVINLTIFKLDDIVYYTTSYIQVYYKQSSYFKVAVNGANTNNVSRGFSWYACGY